MLLKGLDLSKESSTEDTDSVVRFLDQLSAEKINDFELVRYICQRWFLAFCLFVMPEDKFMRTKIHTHLAECLQDLYQSVKDGHKETHIFELPPQTGKSTLVSELFPAWVLGKERWPINCASYALDLAQQKSRNCQEIISSQAYQIIFPNTKLHPSSTAMDFWRTTTGGSYKAIGVEGGLTGFPGKLQLCDDPFKDGYEANSETHRQKVWKWWMDVFDSRKQNATGFCLVNTRWHLDDLTGRLLAQQEDLIAQGVPAHQMNNWRRHRFPAIAEEDEYIDGKLFRQKGEVLCPERFSIDTVMTTKNTVDVYTWSALYQQDPILSENAMFKKEWFKFFTEDEIKQFKHRMYVYITIDPASSKKMTADNSVIQVVGKLRDRPEWYHLEEIAGKMDPKETIDHLFRIVDEYSDYLGDTMVKKIGIESVAYQSTLAFWVKEKMRATGRYLNIEELKRSKSKQESIEGLVPLYKMGIIRHREGIHNDYMKELLQFPSGKHDDRIDAMSMMLKVIPNTNNPDKGHGGRVIGGFKGYFNKKSFAR